MAFQRKRDEWDDLLKNHSDKLQKYGIPHYILSDKHRFIIFFQDGNDEYGWEKGHQNAFDQSQLTDQQVASLAKLLGDQIDDSLRVRIESRWTRH